jgi:hypothetical protein
MVQHRPGGVSQAQATHYDVELHSAEFRQSQFGQRDLPFGEQAGHQELITELDLVHLYAESKLRAAPQAQLAERSAMVSQFFEIDVHGGCRRSPGGEACKAERAVTISDALDVQLVEDKMR